MQLNVLHQRIQNWRKHFFKIKKQKRFLMHYLHRDKKKFCATLIFLNQKNLLKEIFREPLIFYQAMKDLLVVINRNYFITSTSKLPGIMGGLLSPAAGIPKSAVGE